MKIDASDPDDYCRQVPDERRAAFNQMRKVILANLPTGFEETMNYGMIGYVVPKSIYPAGYHCDPDLPLPLINIANQKNFLALYHMAVYSDSKLLTWWQTQYAKHCKYKLDMGKSCIRFKRMDDIPFKLIGQLTKKVTVKNWIKQYETSLSGRQAN